jgi:hypothetical protein
MKWPFARRPGGALRHASALAAIVLIAGCGGSDAPNAPASPSPSPSPQGPGPVVGPYLLEVLPAAACAMGGPLSFPMVAAAAGTAPYPGVQVLVVGAGQTLELELRSAASTVTGGFGTTEAGALANESVRLWVHAIGSGAVTRAADGRGQVAAGRLAGYVAFGHAGGVEGSLGSCDSLDHSFTLRAR